jgi:hypothetical protein
MIKKLTKSLMFSAVLAGFSATASAELVTKDWINLGDELITYDTLSELHYLDLSFTLDTSFTEIKSRLETDLSGWRLPTETEVSMLFDSAFIEPLTFSAEGLSTVEIDTKSYNESNVFVEKLGSHESGYAYGLYKDDSDILRMAGVYAPSGNKNTIIGIDYVRNYDYAIDVPHPHFATFLVSGRYELPAPSSPSSVPAPAGFLLSCIGLLGFCVTRKIKKVS